MEKKELAQINEKIPELEQKIQNLNNEMNFVSDYETIHSLSLKRDLLEQELEEFTMRWMELEEKNEG